MHVSRTKRQGFMFHNCQDVLPEFQEIQWYQGLQNCYLGYHDLGELGEHAVYMYIIHTIAAFTTAWTQRMTSEHRLRNRTECMLYSNLLMIHIHAHTANTTFICAPNLSGHTYMNHMNYS